MKQQVAQAVGEREMEPLPGPEAQQIKSTYAAGTLLIFPAVGLVVVLNV